MEHGVRYKDLNYIRIALNKGADIHTGNEYPLREAIRLNHSEVVKYLIDKGASIPHNLVIGKNTKLDIMYYLHEMIHKYYRIDK